MGTPEFFTHDDEYIGEKYGRIDDGWYTDPVLPLYECINGESIVGSEKNYIEPDGGLPPCRTCPLQWIKTAAPPMDHIDQERQWPQRILKIIRIFNNKLFKINNICNIKQIEKEEGKINVIGFTFF
jgi:hypothetical protein